MPYDLYGTYYASARDAENAELAQMAAIDADLMRRDMQDHTQRQQREEYNLWQYIHMLEGRIIRLERMTIKSRIVQLWSFITRKLSK